MKSILFVCLGNICRSPLAEGIARKIVEDLELDIEIDSAGTGNWHVGEPPCENSVKVAKNNAIDISNLRARVIRADDEKKFDHIVVMDESNYKNLKSIGFTNIDKLGNFGGYDGIDVPDPYYYEGFEGFDIIYDMLNQAIWDFLKTKELLK